MRPSNSPLFPHHKLWLVATLIVAIIGARLIPALSEDAAAPLVKITGNVDKPLELSPADLQLMPRAQIQVQDHGEQTTFGGVSLWEIINQAKPRLGDKPKNGIARGIVTIKGADDYRAVFALAEIAPDFANSEVILADRRNGKPFPDSKNPFQVIVPGDQIHARWVRQVTTIEVSVPSVAAKPGN